MRVYIREHIENQLTFRYCLSISEMDWTISMQMLLLQSWPNAITQDIAVQLNMEISR